MIAVLRTSDKTSGQRLPLVIITLGAEDVVLTTDTDTPVSAVGLDPASARRIAWRIFAMADEIEMEAY